MVKKFLFIFCICVLLSLTGCWDSKETNELAIVAGIAVDQSTSQKYNVTSQIINIPNISSQDGSESSRKPYVNISSEGQTVHDALHNDINTQSRSLYYPHSQILLISEDIVKDSIYPVIEGFVRNPEVRTILWPFITKGEAKQLLAFDSKTEDIPAMYIGHLASRSQDALCDAYIQTLHNSLHVLQSDTSSLVLGMLKYDKTADCIQYDGSAVFKHNKMIGTLNKEETNGIIWCTKKISTGSLLAKCSESEEYFTVHIESSQNKITVSMKDEQITADIKVHAKGNIHEFPCSVDLLKEESLHKIEDMISKKIQQQILSAVKKSKEYNADIFQLGDRLIRKYPHRKDELVSSWDQLYPKIEININVSVEIPEVGLFFNFE
ncbi:MAG: Ger(x)C family spore germination protein [Clostridia bacterium]|nr:Ger(x)C family spore germination protein [Clostridia bacterium]